MLLLSSFLSLIVTAAFAAPPDPEPSILTSFENAGCSDDQTNNLNQNVNDAVTLASAGLDYINDELVVTCSSYGHQQVDLSNDVAVGEELGEEFGAEDYEWVAVVAVCAVEVCGALACAFVFCVDAA